MSRRVRRRLSHVRPRPALAAPAGALPPPAPRTRPAWVTPARAALAVLAAGERLPRTTAVGSAMFVAAVAGALGGPVAAVVAAVYSAIATAAFLGARRRRRLGQERAAIVDAVAILAADLRAGLPAQAAMAEVLPVLARIGGSAGARARRPGHGRRRVRRPADRVAVQAARRLDAALRISERLGAPLSDLLDRVETDLRAAERLRLGVAAQTAAARATTWLLAALPVAGVALGHGMGVDPLHALLHTPLGAACAVAALGLQCTGLAWSAWLTGMAGEEVA
jgi:tight adherence protein B